MYFNNELLKAYFHSYRTSAYIPDKTEENFPLLIIAPSQCSWVTYSLCDRISEFEHRMYLAEPQGRSLCQVWLLFFGYSLLFTRGAWSLLLTI